MKKNPLIPIIVFCISSVIFLFILEGILRVTNALLENNLISGIAGKHNVRSINILCLGDSYTVGGMGDFKDSYPKLLENRLRDAYGDRLKILNAGVCESNTTQAFNRLRKLSAIKRIDYVILLTGSANMFNLLGYDDYSGNKTGMLERLRLYKIARILAANLRGRIASSKNRDTMKIIDFTYKTFSPFDIMQVRESAADDVKETLKAFTAMAASGDYLSAERYLTGLMNADPGEKCYYFYLGVFYQMQGRLEAAEAVFKNAISMFPTSSLFYTQLANCYLSGYSYQIAETAFTKDGEVLPLQDFPYYRSGNSEKRNISSRDIERLYTKAMKLDPENQIIPVCLAIFHISQHRLNDAERILLNLADNGTRRIIAYNLLADIYRIREDTGNRTRILEKALSVKPESSIDLIQLANVYINLNRPDEAEKILIPLLDASSDNQLVYEGLSSIYRARGDTGMEKRILQEGLNKAYPKNVLNRRLLVTAYKSGQMEEMLNSWMILIESSPREFHQYYHLTKVFGLQSKYTAEDIIGFLERLMQRDPSLKKDPTFMHYLSYFKDRRAWEKRIYDWIEYDLERIIDYCSDRGIRLILMNYPYPYHGINEILQRTALAHGLPFIDNFSVFDSLVRQNSPERYFKNDDHCTTEGHEIMADLIIRTIKEHHVIR
ncbi:MAG: tetratricopeptide repeat protein [Elusimicrobia bacterium]|nr:tetratricopeptide repeat protein [Elusimicrobiota bacterium]